MFRNYRNPFSYFEPYLKARVDNISSLQRSSLSSFHLREVVISLLKETFGENDHSKVQMFLLVKRSDWTWPRFLRRQPRQLGRINRDGPFVELWSFASRLFAETRKNQGGNGCETSGGPSFWRGEKPMSLKDSSHLFLRSGTHRKETGGGEEQEERGIPDGCGST